MMMAVKKIDGRYYLQGYVQESPIQKGVYIYFMIDTSLTHTIISKTDAVNNLIKLDKLEIKKVKFEVGNEQIDAYVYPNCEISIPSQTGKGNPTYRETLEKVYIPFKNISANRKEADVSRLGLDFLEKFTISFQTVELDGDQVIILKYPDKHLP